MLALASVEQLLARSREPALLIRVPTGALPGRRWDQLDAAQLQRVLAGEFGQNPGMIFTARTELARRGDGPRASCQMRLGIQGRPAAGRSRILLDVLVAGPW